MTIDYDLTLGGALSLDEVAARALPRPSERPVGTPPLLTADLSEAYGLGVSVLGQRHRFLSADGDDGGWEWDPADSVLVSCAVSRDVDHAWAVDNAVAVFARVLRTGDEDAALVLNYDTLLLTRFGGVLVKHHRHAWWSRHPQADRLIPAESDDA